jgi:Holliday junction resolvase YEN1
MPSSFPDPKLLLLYAKPLTSWSEGTAGPDLSMLRPQQPDVAKLAGICKRRFGWEPTPGVLKKFVSVLWDGVCVRMLCAMSVPFRCSAMLSHTFNQTQSHDEKDTQFALSAVTGIRSSKSAKNGLKFYRIAFSTLTLTRMVNVGISDKTPTVAFRPDLLAEPRSKAKAKHLAWIPAPVLEHALPSMVMKYNQSMGNFPNCEPLALKPVRTLRLLAEACYVLHPCRFYPRSPRATHPFKAGQTPHPSHHLRA